MGATTLTTQKNYVFQKKITLCIYYQPNHYVSTPTEGQLFVQKVHNCIYFLNTDVFQWLLLCHFSLVLFLVDNRIWNTHHWSHRLQYSTKSVCGVVAISPYSNKHLCRHFNSDAIASFPIWSASIAKGAHSDVIRQLRRFAKVCNRYGN